MELIDHHMASFSQLQFVMVRDRRIAYRDAGHGPPIIFVHGNPTHSYFWRKIVPFLSQSHRCIALDLIGMGHSDKLSPIGFRTYSYFVIRDYFDSFLDSLDVPDTRIFIGHNWGVPLTFDWASRHPEQVSGMVHIEGQFTAMLSASLDERFKTFRRNMLDSATQDQILNDNAYLRRYFLEPLRHVLSESDVTAYTAPFTAAGEERRVMIDLPLEIPFDGEPADVASIFERLQVFMQQSSIPKLFIRPASGSIMIGERLRVARSFAYQDEVAVPGGQFAPEEYPKEIADAITSWLHGRGL